METDKIKQLLASWEKRNINGVYCDSKERAIDTLLAAVPLSASVGFSGSVTLDQLGLMQRLEGRGNKVFNQYQPGLSRQENLAIRRLGSQADYYLTSANALAATGELVFFSGYGNRTSGISYAEHVIVVCGINKITADLPSALKRSREYATPRNCKRLSWDAPCLKDGICKQDICFFPEYKRMCCQVLVIEAEVAPGRLQVILVGEDLGF